MARPLLALSILLALGAACGPGLPVAVAAFLLGLAASAAALATVVRTGPPACAALAAAALAVGAAGASVDRESWEHAPLRRLAREAEDTGPVRLVGVASADGREADRWTLLLDVAEVDGQSHRSWGRARLDVGGSAARAEVLEGDALAVWAQLHPPRGLANPGGRDAVSEAWRDGIHAYGYVKSPRLVTVGEAARGAGTAGARVRRWARDVFAGALPPGPEAALVRAMVLGDRSRLDPAVAEEFRAAGTYHVLALSGAQVALLAGLLAWCTRRVPAPRALRALLVAAAIAFYADLVGGEVPVIRAAFMAIVVLLGRGLDLDSDLANLLGLAAGALLVREPSAVGDVSFQLSFVATLGLLVLGPPLVARLPRLPLRADLVLAASVAAQAAVTPLLALHFHRLAPAALVLNLLAVPLSAAVLLAGFGLLACAAVAPPLNGLAADVAWIASHALLRSADPVRWVPALDLRVPALPWLLLGAYGAAVAAFASAPRRARALGLGLVAAAVFALRTTTGADGRLHLEAVDVGQGDAVVLRSPRGRVWMVDAGGALEGRFDVGETVVAPYLLRAGVRRVDRLVLTHAHPDHVGGAAAVLRAFGVGEVWEGPAPRRDLGYGALDRDLRHAGVARRAVVRGASAEWDGVRIDVVGPPPPSRPPWKTRNDDSVVLVVTYGDVRLLLAGDVEAAGERALATVPVAALKVPHHGSRTSSSEALLTAAQPRVAVVSVGYRSRFGHPHPEVVARYEHAGVRLLRTDRDGAIVLSTDGQRLWMRTAREPRPRLVR